MKLNKKNKEQKKNLKSQRKKNSDKLLSWQNLLKIQSFFFFLICIHLSSAQHSDPPQATHNTPSQEPIEPAKTQDTTTSNTKTQSQVSKQEIHQIQIPPPTAEPPKDVIASEAPKEQVPVPKTQPSTPQESTNAPSVDKPKAEVKSEPIPEKKVFSSLCKSYESYPNPKRWIFPQTSLLVTNFLQLLQGFQLLPLLPP